MYKNTQAALLCTQLWLCAVLFPVASIAGEATNVGQSRHLISVMHSTNSTDWMFVIDTEQELWGDMMKDEQVATISGFSQQLRADMAFRLPDAAQQQSEQGGLGAVLTEMNTRKTKMTVRLEVSADDPWTAQQDGTGKTWLVFNASYSTHHISVLKADDVPVGPGDYHLTVEGTGWTE